MSAVPSLCPRSQVHERNETGTSRAGSRHEDLLTDSLRLAMPAPFSKPMVFAAVLLLAVVSLYALKRRCGRAARYYALVAATGSLALVLFNAPSHLFGKRAPSLVRVGLRGHRPRVCGACGFATGGVQPFSCSLVGFVAVLGRRVALLPVPLLFVRHRRRRGRGGVVQRGVPKTVLVFKHPLFTHWEEQQK